MYSISILLQFSALFSFICVASSASIKSIPDFSDPDYDAWLRELESQIIQDNPSETKPEDANQATPTVQPPALGQGNIDYDTEVVEPPVVTAKPYLTGESGETINEKLPTSHSWERPEDSVTLSIDESNSEIDVRARKLLDEILSNLPNGTIFTAEPDPAEDMEYVPQDGSEMTSFVFIIKNRTTMLILCTALIICVILALTVCFRQTIISPCGSTSKITLISHHEYGDIIVQ